MASSDTPRQHIVPLRGTQRLVDTFSRCWRRPSLTALEVLWRWAYGIPVLLVLGMRVLKILRAVSLQQTGVANITVFDPLQAAQLLTNAAIGLSAPLIETAKHFTLPLILLWGVASGFGRTMVLWRMERVLPELRPLHRKTVTFAALQIVRILALGASFAFWFAGLQWATKVAITENLQANREANLVLFAALVIVLSLGLFTLWAVVSWIFSAAPMLAAVQGTGFFRSLRGALQLGSLTSKFVEINLVMGIIKLALLVLAMVFSATPLPFESVTTDTFLHGWWGFVMMLYLLASDFFHVARSVAYIEIWKMWNNPAGLPAPAFDAADSDDLVERN